MKAKRKIVQSYFIVAAGCVFMAAAVNLVYEPLSMVPGGFAGISILVKHLTGGIVPGGIPTGVTTFALNIPLYIFAMIQKGFTRVLKMLYGMSVYTLALLLIPEMPIADVDYLMAAVLGGTVTGIGLALIFSQGMSTGGTDLLCLLLQKYFPHFSVAKLLMIVDGIVVVLGATVFGVRNAIYAVVAVYLTTKVMDRVLEGMSFAKKIQIITNAGQKIGKRVMEEMDRGITMLPATGMYTGEAKEVLLCILSSREVTRIREIVHQEDEKAFVIVSDVREVLGEGFIKNVQ